MILAAGLGKRMRPLTDTLPKPLLPVADKPLIEYHIENLIAAGVREFVINVAYLGECIESALGDGRRWGISIVYSREPEPLETAGAIHLALPLLGCEPFLLVNGDIWTDYDFAQLAEATLPEGGLGRLVLVPNPEHNPNGDFCLQGEQVCPRQEGRPAFTFSGVSLMSPQLIAQYPRRRPAFPLLEVLLWAMEARRLQAEVYTGQWWDIGTPERLSELDRRLRAERL